jgi:hypothetical protein
MSMEPPSFFNGRASTLYVAMADSISHSVFIVVAQRGIKRNAHINQRAEHSSP